MKISSAFLFGVFLLAFLSACAPAPTSPPTPLLSGEGRRGEVPATVTTVPTLTATPLPTATATPTPEVVKPLDFDNKDSLPDVLREKMEVGHVWISSKEDFLKGRFWAPFVGNRMPDGAKTIHFGFDQSSLVLSFDPTRGIFEVNGAKVPYDSKKTVFIATCGPVFKEIGPEDLLKIPPNASTLQVYVYLNGSKAGTLAAVVRSATDEYCRR